MDPRGGYIGQPMLMEAVEDKFMSERFAANTQRLAAQAEKSPKEYMTLVTYKLRVIVSHFREKTHQYFKLKRNGKEPDGRSHPPEMIAVYMLLDHESGVRSTMTPKKPQAVINPMPWFRQKMANDASDSDTYDEHFDEDSQIRVFAGLCAQENKAIQCFADGRVVNAIRYVAGDPPGTSSRKETKRVTCVFDFFFNKQTKHFLQIKKTNKQTNKQTKQHKCKS